MIEALNPMALGQSSTDGAAAGANLKAADGNEFLKTWLKQVVQQNKKAGQSDSDAVTDLVAMLPSQVSGNLGDVKAFVREWLQQIDQQPASASAALSRGQAAARVPVGGSCASIAADHATLPPVSSEVIQAAQANSAAPEKPGLSRWPGPGQGMQHVSIAYSGVMQQAGGLEQSIQADVQQPTELQSNPHLPGTAGDSPAAVALPETEAGILSKEQQSATAAADAQNLQVLAAHEAPALRAEGVPAGSNQTGKASRSWVAQGPIAGTAIEDAKTFLQSWLKRLDEQGKSQNQEIVAINGAAASATGHPEPADLRQDSSGIDAKSLSKSLDAEPQVASPQASLGVQVPDVPVRNGSPAVVLRQPLDHPAWQQDFGDRVVWMAGKSLSAAEFQLTPPSLGPLEVRIQFGQREGEQASISFSSQHAAVREAIEAGIPKLREMLANHQIELAEINISQHSFADRRGEFGGSPNSGGYGGGENFNSGSGEETSTPSADSLSSSPSDRLLSLYA